MTIEWQKATLKCFFFNHRLLPFSLIPIIAAIKPDFKALISNVCLDSCDCPTLSLSVVKYLWNIRLTCSRLSFHCQVLSVFKNNFQDTSPWVYSTHHQDFFNLQYNLFSSVSGKRADRQVDWQSHREVEDEWKKRQICWQRERITGGV